jgi:hypothetical protein
MAMTRSSASTLSCHAPQHCVAMMPSRPPLPRLNIARAQQLPPCCTSTFFPACGVLSSCYALIVWVSPLPSPSFHLWCVMMSLIPIRPWPPPRCWCHHGGERALHRMLTVLDALMQDSNTTSPSCTICVHPSCRYSRFPRIPHLASPLAWPPCIAA